MNSNQKSPEIPKKRQPCHYYCKLCDYSCVKPSEYNRHLLRKKHIMNTNNIKQFICDCGITYNSKQGLWKHKKKCNIVNTIEEPNEDVIYNDIDSAPDTDKKTLIEIILKEREQFEKEREQFQKEKEELLKQIETEKQRHTIVGTNNTNHNLNIQINAFGCENLEHITDEFKVKCLKQIYKSIPEMVAKIHFNTKYPENHNVKIPNKKLPYASVMTADNVWKTVDKKNTITSMVDKSFYLLDGTYEEHKEELSEFKRKNYEKYQEKYLKNDKQLHKQLHNDVECLVLDGTR
jgi:hypothetical protein